MPPADHGNEKGTGAPSRPASSSHAGAIAPDRSRAVHIHIIRNILPKPPGDADDTVKDADLRESRQELMAAQARQIDQQTEGEKNRQIIREKYISRIYWLCCAWLIFTVAIVLMAGVEVEKFCVKLSLDTFDKFSIFFMFTAIILAAFFIFGYSWREHDTKKRQRIHKAVAFFCVWLSLMALLIFMMNVDVRCFDVSLYFKLTDYILIALLTTTLAKVVGLFYLAAKWLFPPEKKQAVPDEKGR